MSSRTFVWLLVTLACAAVQPLRADFLVGAQDVNNCPNQFSGACEGAEPFGDGQALSYQQLYLPGSLPALSGPTEITGMYLAVDFLGSLNSIGDVNNPSLYLPQFQVTLSTVDPSTVDLLSNVTAEATALSLGSVPGVSETLTASDPTTCPTDLLSAPANLTSQNTAGPTTPAGCLQVNFANPVDYTPGSGQGLLLDVQNVTPNPSDLSFYFSMAVDDVTTDGLTSAAGDYGCSGICVNQYQSGLVTEFIAGPVPPPPPPPALPESSPAGLLAATLGLLAIGGRRLTLVRSAR